MYSPINPVGIEAMNVYGGGTYVDAVELCAFRGLEPNRFENLMIKEKTVAMPYEDPVSFAINAAFPIVSQLSEKEVASIEMVIACTESGIDFGKSISTYIHHYLGLKSSCRLFEIKQACYSGTAGMQMAINFLLSGTSPGAKVLVIATDVSRFALSDANAIQEWAYSEPTSGAGAVAILLSDKPYIFRIDPGAYGNHAFEVMDTCRPGPDTESGDADLSLMAYLDCCEYAYKDYVQRVEGADLKDSFSYLCFHTPFGGMVKGAHRQLMRKICRATPAEIEADFIKRVSGSMIFGKQVGNTAGASVLLALAGIIETGNFTTPKRVGLFSYGSGCCSEFFSGVIPSGAQERLRKMSISSHLNMRYRLTMPEYELILQGGNAIRFGVKDSKIDYDILPDALTSFKNSQRFVLDRVENYHRKYQWL